MWIEDIVQTNITQAGCFQSPPTHITIRLCTFGILSLTKPCDVTRKNTPLQSSFFITLKKRSVHNWSFSMCSWGMKSKRNRIEEMKMNIQWNTETYIHDFIERHWLFPPYTYYYIMDKFLTILWMPLHWTHSQSPVKSLCDAVSGQSNTYTGLLFVAI